MNSEEKRIGRIKSEFSAVVAYAAALGVSRNGSLMAEVARRVQTLTPEDLDQQTEPLGRLVDGLRLVAEAYDYCTADTVTEGARLLEHLDAIWTELAGYDEQDNAA